MRIRRLISILVAAAIVMSGIVPASFVSADEPEYRLVPILGKDGNSPEFDVAYPFSDGLALVRKGDLENGKWGFINRAGRVVVPLKYDNASTFNDGLAPVEKGGKWGYIDKTGSAAIPLTSEYDYVYPFSNGLAPVRKGDEDNGKYGFIDRTGKVVVPPEYDWIDDFNDDLAMVRKGDWDNGKWGFIDKSGKVVVPPEYDYAYAFDDGLALVRKGDWQNGKWGYIDKTGGIVVPPEYDWIDKFSEGLAPVTKDGKWGFIDKNVNIIIPITLEYDHVSDFSEGLAMVRKDGKYGYMNKIGRVVIPLEYDHIEPFSDGLAPVKKDNKWGFINKTGDVIIPITLEYDNYLYFSDGLARIKKNGKWGYINRTGRVVIPPEYDELEPFNDRPAKVSKNGKWGFIDRAGNVVVPLEYDFASSFSEGCATLQKNGKGYVLILDDYDDDDEDTDEQEAYIYDEADVGDGITLPTERLDQVNDKDSAVAAVSEAVSGATAKQKASPTGTDLLTLYAQEAALRASSEKIDGSDVLINKENITKIEEGARGCSEAVVQALESAGVDVQREIGTNVLFSVSGVGSTSGANVLNIIVNPSSASTRTDSVRVDTPNYSMTVPKKVMDETKGGGALVITVTEISGARTYEIKFSRSISGNVTVSIPVTDSDTKYIAVFNSSGRAVGGKYNPVTKTIDFKTSKSDKYVVKENKVDFSDISTKSREMQEAINILASKGIINGTSAGKFSPDVTISRAEIAALIVRAISKLNAQENGGFTDVLTTDWYFGAAGSAKKYGIMNGVSATAFSPKTDVKKDQIIAIAARVLKTEMNYKAPSTPVAHLGAYSDSAAIPAWAQSDVALATREGLVVRRYDGAFAPTGTMTRGDVAVILYRLFKKLW